MPDAVCTAWDDCIPVQQTEWCGAAHLQWSWPYTVAAHPIKPYPRTLAYCSIVACALERSRARVLLALGRSLSMIGHRVARHARRAAAGRPPPYTHTPCCRRRCIDIWPRQGRAPTPAPAPWQQSQKKRCECGTLVWRSRLARLRVHRTAHAHDAGALAVGRFTLTPSPSFSRTPVGRTGSGMRGSCCASLCSLTTLLGPIFLYIALPQPPTRLIQAPSCQSAVRRTTYNNRHHFVKVRG